MISEEEALVILTRNPFCVFFGSGISKQSKLPDGKEFAKEILCSLGIPCDTAKMYANEYHLERLLSILGTVLGKDIIYAYDALKTENFGLNHLALAELHKKIGIPLLTTNQDELIEKSVPGIKESDSFIKLHGTVSDINTLSVTLERVSYLPIELFDKITKTTKNKLILVIGYSFSDFDLRNFFEFNSESILYCLYKNDSESRKKYLKFFQNKKSKYDEKRIINYSSPDFLKRLAYAFGINIGFKPKHFNNDYYFKNFLLLWSSRFKDYEKKLALSKLGKGLWKGKSTYIEMKAIYNDVNIPNFYRLYALAEASNAAEALNKYLEQKELVKNIKEFKGLSFNIRMFFYHFYKASYYHIQDNPIAWVKAIINYKKSRLFFEKLKNEELTNKEIEIIYSFEKNIDHGIASTEEKLNRIIRFQKISKSSISITNDYIENKKCDIDMLCEFLFIRAKLFTGKKDYIKAKSDYFYALDIAEAIKKYHSINQALRGLGRIFGLSNDFSKAENFLYRSLEIETEESLLKGRCYLTLSWLYKRKSNFYKKTNYNEFITNLKKSKFYRKKGRDIYINCKKKIKGYFESSLYLKRGN
jgi:hypothetical protein